MIPKVNTVQLTVQPRRLHPQQHLTHCGGRRPACLRIPKLNSIVPKTHSCRYPGPFHGNVRYRNGKSLNLQYLLKIIFS